MEIGLPLDIRQVEIDAASGELEWERRSLFPIRGATMQMRTPKREAPLSGPLHPVAEWFSRHATAS